MFIVIIFIFLILIPHQTAFLIRQFYTNKNEPIPQKRKNSLCRLKMEYDYTGLFNDMGTVFASNAISDLIAQITEKRKLDPLATVTSSSTTTSATSSSSSLLPQSFDLDFERTKRFAFFGFFDGAFGHTWFLLLDYYITGITNVDVVYKVIADTVIFTPLWCIWFLVVMGILEGSLVNKLNENKLQSEYKELLAIDLA